MIIAISNHQPLKSSYINISKFIIKAIIELVNQSESSNNFFLPFAGALVFETGDTKSSSSPANKLFDF
jgi:hypothetical protein